MFKRADTYPILLFMAATAMATTISTLTATALVKADMVTATAGCDRSREAATPVTQPDESEMVQQVAEAPPHSYRVTPMKAPVPSADSGPTATAAAGYDKKILRRIIKAHINEVRFCYNQGLARDAQLAGRVEVHFEINGQGTAEHVDVSNSDLGDAEVETCIAKRVEAWKFVRPRDGQSVAVTYPFVLEPG